MVIPGDGLTPAGIHSSPPHSASTVILQGQWLSLKEKYWQAGQSSMNGADLQFDCHHYLMLWTQDEGGGRQCSESILSSERSRALWYFDLLSFKKKNYVNKIYCHLYKGAARGKFVACKRLIILPKKGQHMMEIFTMNTQSSDVFIISTNDIWKYTIIRKEITELFYSRDILNVQLDIQLT